MNIMFACVVVLVMSWLIPASRTVADTGVPGEKGGENKAVTIVIEPPEGREKEFLEEFVKSQALYMKAYGAQSTIGVYKRGALTLHALRLRIGDGDFFALIRRWTEKYAYRCVTTEDFIALASTFTKAPLGDIWQDWLFTPALPPFPSMR